MISRISSLMECNMEAVKKVTKKKENKQAKLVKARTKLAEDQKQITRFSVYVKTCETEIKSSLEKQIKLESYIGDISDILKSVRLQCAQ